MTINYTQASGQLRLLISDVDEANQILANDAVVGFLGMWGLQPTDAGASRATLKRAAADALDAIATSEALVSKVIRTQDLSTDGPKTATALREHAARLRAQASDDDQNETDAADDVIEVIEFSPYPSSWC